MTHTMRIIVSLIVSGVLLVGLPVYLQFVWEQIKASGWRKAVKHILLIILIVPGVFFATWFGVVTTTPVPIKESPKLEFLTKANLEEEARMRGFSSNQASGQALRIIKAKFDDANYAESKNDFDHALKIYGEIEVGADENGSFATFPSACIKNDMAIAFFRKQNDRGFKASGLLIEALRLGPKPSDQIELIQRNIEALDKYVNQ